MTWWDAIPVLLGALVVVFGCGGAVLVAAGVRGLALLALAPPVTAAVLGGGAVIAGFLGVPWQSWFGLLATVLGVLVALLLRRLLGPPRALAPSEPTGNGRVVAVAVAVAALVGALPLAAGMRQVDRVVQTWDTVFHLNAIRYIEDTGNASTFLLQQMVNDSGNAGIYPAGWHVMATAVAEPLSADPVVVANILTLILGGLVIPGGMALLVRALLPEWRWAAAVGAITGSVFTALPAMMVSWGTLFPNAWGTGMLPALLGATILCLRRADWTSVLVVLAGGAGAVLLHPSSLFGFLFLALPVFVHALVRRWRRMWTAARWRVGAEIAGLLALAAAVPVVLDLSGQLAYVRGFRWGQANTPAQAIGEALMDAPLSTLGHGPRAASWAIGALLLVGVIRASKNSRHRTWIVVFLVAIALYTISTAAPSENGLRDYVTGFWYNDPVRVASLLPVAAAPLVAIGLLAVAEWFETTVLDRMPEASRGRRLLRVATVPLVVLVFLVISGGGYAAKRAERLTFWYWNPFDEPERQLVTPAEEDMLRRIDDVVPAGSRILADPFNGGALAYALGEREVVFPHLTGTWDETEHRLLELMPDLEDPETCRILDDMGVDYLYIDSDLYVPSNKGHNKFRGLDRVPREGVTLVDSADTAELYEITACR